MPEEGDIVDGAPGRARHPRGPVDHELRLPVTQGPGEPEVRVSGAPAARHSHQ